MLEAPQITTLDVIKHLASLPPVEEIISSEVCDLHGTGSLTLATLAQTRRLPGRTYLLPSETYDFDERYPPRLGDLYVISSERSDALDDVKGYAQRVAAQQRLSVLLGLDLSDVGHALALKELIFTKPTTPKELPINRDTQAIYEDLGIRTSWRRSFPPYSKISDSVRILIDEIKGINKSRQAELIAQVQQSLDNKGYILAISKEARRSLMFLEGDGESCDRYTGGDGLHFEFIIGLTPLGEEELLEQEALRELAAEL